MKLALIFQPSLFSNTYIYEDISAETFQSASFSPLNMCLLSARACCPSLLTKLLMAVEVWETVPSDPTLVYEDLA